jgi:hypothetical protein
MRVVEEKPLPSWMLNSDTMDGIGEEDKDDNGSGVAKKSGDKKSDSETVPKKLKSPSQLNFCDALLERFPAEFEKSLDQCKGGTSREVKKNYETGKNLHRDFMEQVFQQMPISLIIGGKILVAHGGLSPKVTLKRLRGLDRKVRNFH